MTIFNVRIVAAVLSASMLSPTLAHAQTNPTLSDVDQYIRCYTRLVRQVPAANDALLKDVTDKKKTGAVACLALYDRATLKKNTGKVNSTSDAVALEVLRTMHMVHRSWLQSREPAAAGNNSYKLPNSLIQDIEEPAFYYTRAALMEDVRFDSVVLSNDSLRGVRIRANSATVNNFRAQYVLNNPAYVEWKDVDYLRLSYNDVADKNILKPFEVPDNVLVTNGQLVGVEVPDPFVVPFARRPSIPNATTRKPLVDQIDLDRKNHDVRKHLGGGILGSQQFIMANANLTTNQLQLGEHLINRRLTARIFQDLMCHELPTLTDADVKADVDTKSEYAFRQTSSCMRCHSSVDTLAMSYRNKAIVLIGPQLDDQTNLVGWGLPTILAITPKADSTDLNHQSPTSQVRFRELITSKYVNSGASDLAGVGKVLAANQDIYLCAAQRYYRFFTGVNASLVKLDAKSPSYALDKEHQDFVVALGKQLKSTQKVRDVISSIFQSKAFKTRNYNSGIVQEAK